MNRTDISKIWLTPTEIWVETTDGRRSCERFVDYPRLNNATLRQKENYTLSYFGIHWSEIDEDLSFDGFFQHL